MKIFCEICESSWIETTEVIQDPIYRCTMCKDYIMEHESDRVLQDENFDYKLVTDAGN